MLTYGSLFSGVGGFDLGFDQESYECVFQVEWDKHCQKILAKHWPEVPKWSDVQDVNGAEIPPCDVLTFGSPCQDLSVAGKRAGLEGTKSSMFYEATRIIKEMRNATKSVYPRVVIWENVPGALSSNNGADFGAVIDTLADIGAVDIHWSVLDAQYFGVPQRRRRIFVIAIFDTATSERCPDPLLPVAEGSRGDFAKGRKARKDAARSATPGIDSGGQWAAGSTDTDILSTSVCSKWAKGSGGPSGSEHYNMVVETPEAIAQPFVKSRRAQSNTDDETWIEGEVTPTLNAFDNGGESRATVLMPVPIHDQATRFAGRNGEKKGVGKGNGFGIGEPGDPMHTLTQAERHAVLQPFVFDGTRHDDFRMHTETVPTLKQRMGTGGGQVPMLAEPIMYDALNGTTNTVPGTLRTNHASSGDFIAQPIPFKPSGFADYSEGIGTLRTTEMGASASHLVTTQPIFSFDTQFGSNAAVFENQSPTLKATQQSPSVTMPGLAVRRLTPLECERLMGWPDDHTRWKSDGTEQADTQRYKQCGNGVATPVARFIAKHLKNILITNDDQ